MNLKSLLALGHRHLCHKRRPRQTLTSSIYHITSCIHVTSYFQSNVQLSKYIQRAEQNISMAQKGLSSLYSSPHASTEHLPKGGLHFTALHSSLICLSHKYCSLHNTHQSVFSKVALVLKLLLEICHAVFS